MVALGREGPRGKGRDEGKHSVERLPRKEREKERKEESILFPSNTDNILGKPSSASIRERDSAPPAPRPPKTVERSEQL